MKLFSTDFVLLRNGKPMESLDIIYAKESVEEAFANGLILKEGEEFVAMTDLPKELQEMYLNTLKQIN